MAIQLRPLESITEKWRTRAQAASPEYKAGVSAPRVDWSAATVAAKDAQAAGVQEALAQGRYEREVRKAGTAKWQTGSTGKGATRYGTGVQAATADYSSGFAPYAQVLSSISLPPKGARGAAGNLERVRAVADALRAKKTSGAS